MPRGVLDECQICPTLKGQRNKARPHPMRRHRYPNGVCALLDDALYLIGMERPFLGMIAFAKTDEERCFWRCMLTTSSHEVIVNDLPDLNWEFGKTAFVPFAMPNDGHMIALFHPQIADGQCYCFRTTNACA